MGQSRKMSMLEIVTGTSIGLIVSLASNVVIFHAMGKQMTWHENIQMTAYFTVISIIRSFYVRRLFNWLDVIGIKSFADIGTKLRNLI